VWSSVPSRAVARILDVAVREAVHAGRRRRGITGLDPVLFPVYAVREIGARGNAGGIATRLGLAGLVAAIAGCAWVALTAMPVTNEGDVLVDQNGMTLYTFDRDSELKSVCNAQCAVDWPPLAAAAGAKRAGRYAIIARDDGRRQWAYKGKPLYLRATDQKPGDRSGDGVDNLWRIARP